MGSLTKRRGHGVCVGGADRRLDGVRAVMGLGEQGAPVDLTKVGAALPLLPHLTPRIEGWDLLASRSYSAVGPWWAHGANDEVVSPLTAQTRELGAMAQRRVRPEAARSLQ